jgi:predicted nucleic acid-binding protein
MIQVALDTNILVYAEGLNGPAMKALAVKLIQKLPSDKTILPTQVLAELFSVLVRKAGKDVKSAAKSIMSWQDAFRVNDTSAVALRGAIELASHHKLGIWDAIVLATAAASECRLLLSEDLHDGFSWNGVTVTNPFSDHRHALLEALLENSD